MRWQLRLVILVKSVMWTTLYCAVLAAIVAGFFASPIDMIVGGLIGLIFILVYRDVKAAELEKDAWK